MKEKRDYVGQQQPMVQSESDTRKSAGQFISRTFFFTKQTVWTRSEAFSGHEYLLNRGGRIREVSGKANDVKTETMCSTENNAELQTTCKSGIYETVTATSAP